MVDLISPSPLLPLPPGRPAAGSEHVNCPHPGTPVAIVLPIPLPPLSWVFPRQLLTTSETWCTPLSLGTNPLPSLASHHPDSSYNFYKESIYLITGLFSETAAHDE